MFGKKISSMAVVSGLFASSGLAQGALYSSTGDDVNEFFGRACSGADVDGDGFDDVIIGSRGGFKDVAFTGRVLVSSGKTGAILFDLVGSTSVGGFGYAVAGLSDLDGDGCDEFAIGIRPHQHDTHGPGSVRVHSGATGAVKFTLTGSNVYDLFGHVVANAGDVNKDGKDDIIVSAPEESSGGVESGGVWVFSGANGSVIWHIAGAAGAALGNDVDGIGDVNSDGYADFVVGAALDPQGGGYAGKVHVYSGKTGAQLYAIVGNANSQAGAAVAGLGDVSGDGKPDFAYGAFSDSTMGASAGKVVVCSGPTGAVLYTLYGTAGNSFGYKIDRVLDVNGDGRDEIVVGAPWTKLGIEETGMARVHSGSDGSILATIHGLADGDYVGYDVAGSLDVNADGRGEIVIGSPGSSLAGSGKGSATVYSLECGSTSTYGSGCAGFGGFVPQLALGGCATPGGTMNLAITKGNGGKPVLLFIGSNATNLPVVGGCTLLTFPLLTVIPSTLGGLGAGAGALNALGKLPIEAPLGAIRMQAFVIDPQVARGYSASNGVAASIE